MPDELGITTLGSKGQVVIPQKLRKQLGIAPHTKFLVYGQGDVIVLRRLEMPDVKQEWRDLLASRGRLRRGPVDVDREVQAVRRSRRKQTR